MKAELLGVKKSEERVKIKIATRNTAEYSGVTVAQEDLEYKIKLRSPRSPGRGRESDSEPKLVLRQRGMWPAESSGRHVSLPWSSY